MKCALILMTRLAFLTLLFEPSRAQHGEQLDAQSDATDLVLAQQPGGEAEFAVTPNTIRIQSTDSPKNGSWVVVPGFSELGSPCLSRDGNWIAFDGYRNGFKNSSAETWIARRDGLEPVRVASGATPRWSPDGTQLLFCRAKVDDPGSEKGIFLIDRDGSNERRIGEGRWPDWSPDGKQIVYSLGGEETGGARVGARIYISNLDGSGRREISEGDCPSWSPDGQKIAFCARRLNRTYQICVRDLQKKRILTLGVGWYRANWTPDSKFVVANGLIGRKVGMVRLLVAAPSRTTEFSTEFEEPASPCVSWDGKQIVFIAKRPKSETLVPRKNTPSP
jgi:Tol biopolymer transport system component